MNDYELNNLRETFSRLFVLAVKNKINFKSFTNMLSNSSFIEAIEKDKYNDLFNKPIEALLFSITGFEAKKDNSYGMRWNMMTCVSYKILNRNYPIRKRI